MPQCMKIPNLAWSNSLREAIFCADGTYFSCEKSWKKAEKNKIPKNTNLIVSKFYAVVGHRVTMKSVPGYNIGKSIKFYLTLQP